MAKELKDLTKRSENYSQNKGRKIAQIGQTEPTGVTRRRTKVRREVRFVQNTRHKNKKEFVKNEFLLSCSA